MKIERIAEAHYPWMLALAAGFAAWYFDLMPLNTRIDAQLSATLTVSSILMGFLGTAKAIVLSSSTARKKWLKQNPELWQSVLGFFKWALLANLALSIYSLVLFFVDLEKIAAQGLAYVMPLWAVLVTTAVLSFFRAVSILFLMLNED